jgi:hypothetical protein
MYDGQTIDERGPWVTDDKWSGKALKINTCFQQGYASATSMVTDVIQRVQSQETESILILEYGEIRFSKICRNFTATNTCTQTDIHAPQQYGMFASTNLAIRPVRRVRW